MGATKANELAEQTYGYLSVQQTVQNGRDYSETITDYINSEVNIWNKEL